VLGLDLHPPRKLPGSRGRVRGAVADDADTRCGSNSSAKTTRPFLEGDGDELPRAGPRTSRAPGLPSCRPTSWRSSGRSPVGRSPQGPIVVHSVGKKGPSAVSATARLAPAHRSGSLARTSCALVWTLLPRLPPTRHCCSSRSGNTMKPRPSRALHPDLFEHPLQPFMVVHGSYSSKRMGGQKLAPRAPAKTAIPGRGEQRAARCRGPGEAYTPAPKSTLAARKEPAAATADGQEPARREVAPAGTAARADDVAHPPEAPPGLDLAHLLHAHAGVDPLPRTKHGVGTASRSPPSPPLWQRRRRPARSAALDGRAAPEAPGAGRAAQRRQRRDQDQPEERAAPRASVTARAAPWPPPCATHVGAGPDPRARAAAAAHRP